MSALDSLDEQQRAAASILRGPVCVLAGAGTGKTRVITHRIAHGVDTGAYSPNRVMAVTFTAKAAGEMRGRLRALGVAGVAARTFHASALSQLNYFWPTVTGGENAPSIVDNKVKALAHAADTVGMRLSTPALRDVASEIEWRKVQMRSIEQYAQSGRSAANLSTEAMTRLQQAYETLKDQRRQLDFEDVLLACAGMIEAEPRVATAIREQYRHFTVDEYQDVSPLQHRLLSLWLGERRDICVVGDASQTIFSFAGANNRYLLDFAREHEGATVVKLEKNYRSREAILAVANDLMRGREGALSLVPASDAAAPTPVVTAYENEQAEAEGVAAAIHKQLSQGVAASEIAVLYRAQSQSAALLQALAARSIPAKQIGGRRFFDMPEVRSAILKLRGAAVAPNNIGFLPTVRTVLKEDGLSPEPPPAGGALRDAWEARRAILRLAEDAPEGTTLASFADDLLARSKDQHEPVVDTVLLSTLHAAKGLEWQHVHIIGWAEGLLPISYAQGFEAIDEERRLAYVGVTRAARTLSLSWARGEGRSQRSPSRFLQEVGNRSLRSAGVGARVAGAGR